MLTIIIYDTVSLQSFDVFNVLNETMNCVIEERLSNVMLKLIAVLIALE